MNSLMNLKKACLATRCILLAFGLGLSSLAPMIPYAKTRLGIDDAQLGLILLFFGIGGFISMPVAGVLVRYYGTRTISLFSCLAVLAVLPFISIAASPATFSLVLLLFGIGTGTLNVAINSQAVNVEKKMKTPLMSGFHCLFSAGGLLGGGVISCLLELNFSLFFSALTVSIAMAILLFSQWKKLLPFSTEMHSNETYNKLKMPERKVFLLGIICFVAFMSEGSMLNWSAEFLHSELGYEMAIAGIGYALFSISMALGRLIGDRLKRDFGILAVFQSGAILSAAGFFIAVFLHIPYGALIGFCLVGIGASNLVPIIFSVSGNVSKTSPSVSLSFVTSIGYLGALLGPACVGFIAQATSLSFAFICIGSFMALLALTGSIIKTEQVKAAV